MRTRVRVSVVLGLGVILLLASGCGTEEPTIGQVRVTVDDITSPLSPAVPSRFTITGTNFGSLSGTIVAVRFQASSGTPFADGTSATATVAGAVVSNTTVLGVGPVTTTAESFTALVTVILPSTVSGTSLTPIAQFLGGPATASDDDYDTTGNVRLSVDATEGVLDNDQPEGFVSVTSSDLTSAHGGDVTVQGDGSFTYDPPVGYQGTDTFEYEISDGFTIATATVSVEVTDMIWFIDRAAAAGGDGRFSAPFDDLPAFNAIQGGSAQTGDTVYLYEAGGTAYTGGITLLDGQTLLGQGVDLDIDGDTLVAKSGNPLLTHDTGNAIALASDNTIRGLDVQNSAGRGISGNTVGLLEIELVSVAATGGPALDLETGTLDAAFDGLSSTGSPSEGIFLNLLDGTMLVSDRTTIIDAATCAIRHRFGTVATTYQGITIDGTAGAGLDHLDAGPINVTGTGNTIDTTTGQPLSVGGPIGTNGLTFESISCDGAGRGISLVSTGSAGGLTVTGDGTNMPNGSGGTLENITFQAIQLVETVDTDLSQIDIDTTGEHGIDAQTVSDLTIRNLWIQGAGTAAGMEGISLQVVHGANLIEDVTLDDVNEHAVQIRGSVADDAVQDLVTLRRVTVLDHTAAGFAEHGVDIRGEGVSDLRVVVDDCLFDLGPEAVVGVRVVTTDTASLEVAIQGCVFDAADAFGSGSIEVIASDDAALTLDVVDNDLNGSPFTPIVVAIYDDAAAVARITGNDVDVLPVGHNGYGISVVQDEDGTGTILVQDNDVALMAFDGIRILARDTTDGSGVLHATIAENVVDAPTVLGAGISARAQDDNTLCVNIDGNTVSGTNTVPGADDDIVLGQSGTSSLDVTQRAPTAAVDPGEIDDANGGATVGVAGAPTFDAGLCPIPPPGP